MNKPPKQLSLHTFNKSCLYRHSNIGHITIGYTSHAWERFYTLCSYFDGICYHRCSTLEWYFAEQMWLEFAKHYAILLDNKSFVSLIRNLVNLVMLFSTQRNFLK